jgi:GMP synthase-like glutamine amidotransferase
MRGISPMEGQEVKLNIHLVQHVSFEGPANIATWASTRQHCLSTTHLYRGEALPTLDRVDWVVVLGGPMNVHEYRHHPWLLDEKRFLEKALAAEKTVLGICLGAQMLADVLGAKVYQNPEKEIGWWPVSLRPGKMTARLFPSAPPELTVFHWHGDTFDLPSGATWLASSVGCAHQAFAFGQRAVALQFHIETTASSVVALINHCGDELTEGRFTQTAGAMAADHSHFLANERTLTALLEQLEVLSATRACSGSDLSMSGRGSAPD